MSKPQVASGGPSPLPHQVVNAVARDLAATPTPVPSSPPASESFFSEIDGTAASVLETSYGDITWEPPADASSLNIVSWKLDVDAHVDDGVDRRGFNAISTVLAHPTRRANPLRASRKPLPPLAQPPPMLPKPLPRSHYDSYLQTITPLYESFVTAQQTASMAAAAESQGPSDLDLVAKKTAKADLPSLDDIPATFFDTGFDLANPATWAEVMETGASSSKGSRDDAVQESLSTYLDNLESHLVHEITLRSSAFFSALSNLQDLNSESSSCLTRIADLKSSLGEVGGEQARKGLEIIDAQTRLRSLRITEHGIKRVAELDDILRIAKDLADHGDWFGALGYVEDVVRWWDRNGATIAQSEEGEEPPAASSTLPLTTLPAFANLPMAISALMSNIASQLDGALGAVLLAFLSDADRGEEFDADNLRAKVGPMLGGLLRCGRVDTLAGVWRTAVTTAIREGGRQHLPVSNAEDDTDGTGEGRGHSLAESLQAMSHVQFVDVARRMYGSMLSRLNLVQQMGDEMAAILEESSSITPLSIAHSSGPNAPLRALDASPFDPADVLGAACELANTRSSKILSVRSEQNASLPIEQFVEIFGESWAFVVATETMAKRMIVSLRGVAAQQARQFLMTYHGQRLTKSAKLVEDETWVQVDIPPATQHAVNLFIEAAVNDPPECFVPPRQAANGAANGDTPKGNAKVVQIEDKSYFAVKATSESLQLLAEYLGVVVNVELVCTDVMARIIEFLKSFNSRTCQVVLGAGAMRSAGLKNITAKHLALASQSLSIIIALIPYIREFIRRHLNPKQAVMLIEFDKLKRDYQEHQNEIHAKLVAIMADRLAVHCGELREIDWEAAAGRDGPRQYALMLTKETQTLHKVLSKYLSQATVEGVMSQVLAASVHRLSEEFTKVEFKSEDAKKRMAMDAAYINAKLGPLTEAGTAVSSLETLVKDKATPRKGMRGLLRRNGSSNNDTVPSAGADEGTEAVEDDDEDGDILTEAVPSGDHYESKEEEAGANGGAATGRASEEKQAELTQSAEVKEESEAPKTPEKSKTPLPAVKYAEWSTSPAPRSPAPSYFSAPPKSPERVPSPEVKSPEPPSKSPEPELKSPTPPEKDLPVAAAEDPLSPSAVAPPSPTKTATPPSPTKAAAPPSPTKIEEPRPIPPTPKPRLSLEARLKAKLAAQAAAKPDKPRASSESAERVAVESVAERAERPEAGAAGEKPADAAEKPTDKDADKAADKDADKAADKDADKAEKAADADDAPKDVPTTPPAEDDAKDASTTPDKDAATTTPDASKDAAAPEPAKDAVATTPPPDTIASPNDGAGADDAADADADAATPPPPPKDAADAADAEVVPSIPEAKDTSE
ncbi:hypothetical protein Q8F55_008047 [Vanrija albida]|uniref:Vacuolar protein sorting-associated protein 54 C-terminal domain-containing protein n=1 Tax=Vanrija albida TaxID=181172 RepID=A0ABR3PV95_9TREE